MRALRIGMHHIVENGFVKMDKHTFPPFAFNQFQSTVAVYYDWPMTRFTKLELIIHASDM